MGSLCFTGQPERRELRELPSIALKNLGTNPLLLLGVGLLLVGLGFKLA
jgi:NADH:ubiquinone oxidoreductase subunit 2 (subunit N)